MSVILFVLCYSYDMSVSLFALCYSYDKVTGIPSLRPWCMCNMSVTLFTLCYSYDKVTGISSGHGVCAKCQSPLRLSCENCGVVKSESSLVNTAEGSEVSTLSDSGINEDGEMRQVLYTHYTHTVLCSVSCFFSTMTFCSKSLSAQEDLSKMWQQNVDFALFGLCGTFSDFKIQTSFSSNAT